MSQCRNICLYRLTTCYGLQQQTLLVSILPHSSDHSGDSSSQCPTLPSWPSIRAFTWQGLETSFWSSSRSLDRPTPQRHWICSCPPLETITYSTGPWWSDATARAGYAMVTNYTKSSEVLYSTAIIFYQSVIEHFSYNFLKYVISYC